MSKSTQTQQVIDLWKTFNFESLKSELDVNVIEIAQQLEEGDQSRKKLIEQTKEFRKTLTEEQRKLVAPILKLFQIEVDSSSKRSKLMEQVLLKLYKQLIDLPDPCAALDQFERLLKKCERLTDIEIENKQLRETLGEYNNEFKDVKNQEVTIKLLKEKLKDMESSGETQLQQRIKEKDKEMQRIYADQLEQSKQIQFDLVKKLGDVESRCLNLQNQLNKAQADLFESKSKQDELLNGKSCEIDLLMLDLDKVNERCTNAERLNEQYLQQINSLTKQRETERIDNFNDNKVNELNEESLAASKLNANNFEIELIAKEKEIAHLVEDMQKMQIKFNKSRELFEIQRVQLEERIASNERFQEQYEKELKNKQDYDEIKRELNILKTIEFNLPLNQSNEPKADENLNGEDSSDFTGLNHQQQQKPLELLLLEKNKNLQNELTHYKNKFSDIQFKYDAAQTEHSNLMRMNIEQKSLIIELEKDVHKMAQKIPETKRVKSDNNSTLDIVNETLSSLADTDDNEASAFKNDINSNSAQPDQSLFNIVSNQRERFRARVQELEAENMGNKQQITFLTNELDRLRSDNVKLYEKIKFLQSFSNGNAENGASGVGGALLNKYTNEYEKKLDPFTKFSNSEKHKRYANLKLHDKFTLSFGRFILSSKLARLIFCGYFLVVHLLIFASLYHMAHHTESHRDYSLLCDNHYREHMHKVHGENNFTPPHG